MRSRHFSKIAPLLVLGFGLAACEGQGLAGFDFDLRDNAGGLDTTEGARNATADRPQPDARGVISYPNYQVAVARRGDTVQELASRVGVPAGELARFNGLRANDPLGVGEVVALPGGSAVAGGARSGPLDVTGIATTALDRVPQGQTQTPPRRVIDGPEPVRHRVASGETAFSIARLYGVSVRALSDWNGLGPDLAVRTGQYLLIPVTTAQAPAPAPDVATAPGVGTRTPEPPSAVKPLPDPEPPAKVAPKPQAGSARLARPVSGDVIRPYKKRTNEGIDIAAAAGTAVKAADGGEVAAITRDTEGVPILVLRHADNLLTVYANIADIRVKKGDKISRGQSIASVGKGSPAFLHFEVRDGFESVDPAKFLN